MTTTRVGLVGLGNAGLTLHLPALQQLRSASVVGAYDLDPECRRRAEREWRVPIVSDFDEVLARRPDVVVVGTPPDSHLEYCLRALRAGADVICEKPLASSLAEADAILAAAAAAGRLVAVNHEFREMPIFRAVRDELRRGESGSLVFLQIWQLMDLPPWQEPGWRGRLLQRTLYEAGTHLVDYAISLFGERPLAVQATTSTCGVREDSTDAVALVTLEFSRGRLAQVIQNRLCKGETQYFEVRADAERASFRASFGGRARLSAGLFRSTRPHVRVEYGVSGLAWQEQRHERRLLARNPRNPGVAATRRLFEGALAAFSARQEPPVSARSARDVLEVIAACYRSAAEGRRLRLDTLTGALDFDLAGTGR